MTQDKYAVLEEILDTRDVTVGGGSASAIAGAMAAGLIGMVARLSTKKDYGMTAEAHLAIADECDLLAAALMQGADEDRQAFAKIKAAYALPKASDEEKRARSEAIEAAGIAAATAPLENARRNRRVFELGRAIRNKSNPNAASDVDIGVRLARLGAAGCALNMEANLPLIKDAATLARFNKEILALSELDGDE